MLGIEATFTVIGIWVLMVGLVSLFIDITMNR